MFECDAAGLAEVDKQTAKVLGSKNTCMFCCKILHKQTEKEQQTELTTKFKTCASCRCARYCSKKCQKQHWPVHKHYCDSMAHSMKYYSPILRYFSHNDSETDTMRYCLIVEILNKCMVDSLQPSPMPTGTRHSMASLSSEACQYMKVHNASGSIFLFCRPRRAAKNDYHALSWHLLDYDKVVVYCEEQRDKAIQELLRAQKATIDKQSRKRRAKYWVALCDAMAEHKAEAARFQGKCGCDWAPVYFAFATDFMPIMFWPVTDIDKNRVMLPLFDGNTAKNPTDIARNTKRRFDNPNERKQSAAGR